MKKFYFTLILFVQIICSFGQTFDPNDVAALKTIRDNAQSDSPLKAYWADDSQVGTWQGVDWDYSSPKNVISLNVGGGNNLWSLDVTGLKSLQNLYCNDTPLTSLNVSGLKNIIRIDCYNDHLTSLDFTGLTTLETLSLQHNQLTSLILTGLTNLTSLNCDNNQLTSLSLAGLTSLQNYIGSYNPLTTLDASGLVNLQQLWCDNNLLTSLNLIGLTKLEGLMCFVNPLTSIDVSGLTNLQSLVCSADKLTTIDVSGLSKLSVFAIDGNMIPFSKMPLSISTYGINAYTPQNRIFEEKEITLGQEIDYSSEATIDGIATAFYWYKNGTLIDGTDQSGKYTPVEGGFYRCEMTNAKFPGLTLITSNVKLLTTIVFDPNDIAILKSIRDNAPGSSSLKEEWADESVAGTWPRVEWDNSTPKKVKGLYIATVVLKTLDVTGLNRLQTLQCDQANLFSLNVSGLVNLQMLTCSGNQLTSLNLSGLTSLTTFYCGSNQLSSIDVSGLTNLKTFSCITNDIMSLNVSGLSMLESLDCAYNPLGTLDVSGLVNLQVLDCESDQLTSLNVSGATNLTTLYCLSNYLTSLDVSSLANLHNFSCTDNQINTLDLSGLTNLDVAGCDHNKLTSLNVSGAKNLTVISCNDNNLTVLDVSGLTKLTSLTVYDNNIPFSHLPLVNLPNSSYYIFAPQNKVFEAKEIQLGQEIDYSSEATIDSTVTVFSWYLNGVLIAGTDQSGKYTPAVSGEYYCEMTNDKFPGLTLTTNTVTLNDSFPVLKLVSKFNDASIPATNIIYKLYQKDQDSFVYESLLPVNAGDTTYFNIPSGEWIIMVYPGQNAPSFIPTYVGNVIDWSRAEQVVFQDNVFVFRQIDCINPDTLNEGSGQISGSINLTNTFSKEAVSIISYKADSGKPFEGALVQLFKKGGTIPVTSVLTDSTGVYKFDQLEITDYEIVVEIPGFTQSQKFPVSVSESNPLVSLNFGVNTGSQTITDVNPLLETTIQIYPNPSSGKFTMSSNSEMKSLEVFNQLGERIFLRFNLPGNLTTEMDLSNKGTGIYLLKIRIGNKDYREKVVVR